MRRTPVLTLEAEVAGTPGPVVAKLESLQVTGTFKARNAYAMLASTSPDAAGVVAASGGNFGLAMAHAARRLGHRLWVAVPAGAPAVKVDAIRAEGAEVEVVDGPPAAAFAAARARAGRTGARLAHPYDDPQGVAGAGTCGWELREQAALDTVLVAVGGGGLLAGVAASLAGRARVVAVETAGTPTLYRALQAGAPVEVAAEGLGLSALGAPVIGEIGWAARGLVIDSLLVDDDAVRDAQRRLWAHARIAAEPGGAVALAALTVGAYRPAPGERVGVIVCGGNVDPCELAASEPGVG